MPSQPSQVCIFDPRAARCIPIAPMVRRTITSPCQASATGQGTSSALVRLPVQKPANPRPPAIAATPAQFVDLIMARPSFLGDRVGKLVERLPPSGARHLEPFGSDLRSPV